MFRTEIATEIDDECRGLQGADGHNSPSPSLDELVDLAAVCEETLRVVKIHAGVDLVGLAVCYVEKARVHGIPVKAYRLFGYKLHDYNRIYALNGDVLRRLLEAMRHDAKACGADVVCLENLLPPAAADELTRYSGTLITQLRVFDSTLDQHGWDGIAGRKSVKRHFNRVAALSGYKVESLVGELKQHDIEMIADLHVERWHFEHAASAFTDTRRIQEYLCHTQNKVLTLISLGNEILCCHYGMIYGQTLLWHTPLINVKYLDLSPLEVLLAETASFCHQRGLTCLDLGLGDEAYKGRFANASRTVYDVLIPVSLRGWMLHGFRTHGHPEKVKRALGTARQYLTRARDWLTEMTTRIYWYEKNISTTKNPNCGNLTIIRDYKVFVDFCRAHMFVMRRFHYQRFREGCFFTALHDERSILCCGWGNLNDEFRIGETGQTALTAGRTVLFDFHTPPERRRKGYYTTLLNRLAEELSNQTLAIFARADNHASIRAILNAGFKKTATPIAGSTRDSSNQKVASTLAKAGNPPAMSGRQ